MLKNKPLVAIIFLVLLGGGLVILVKELRKPQYPYANANSMFVPVISPTTAPAVSVPMAKETVIESPDGKMKLTMQEKRENKRITYTFSTSEKDKAEKKLIFTQELTATQSASVPFNTWSPDDKYVFLKLEAGNNPNYYVLSATGNPLSTDNAYINIADLFSQKYTDYFLTDVTGWAAPDLLILNTKKISGEQGPSLWFDIQSQKFIQLSTLFN